MPALLYYYQISWERALAEFSLAIRRFRSHLWNHVDRLLFLWLHSDTHVQRSV